MKIGVRIQLSTMMFLEFFIWGAWFVTMGTFLGGSLKASDIEIGLAYQTQSVGAIIAPFIIGLIADRFFPAQRILGILHLAGGILLWLAASADGFGGFYGLILPYMILYMPTLALVNSISFRQMVDPEKEFAGVRVLGTIGWIVAGLLIGYFNWEEMNQLDLTYRLAAGASIALGLLSFFLPHTPPPKPRGEKVTTRELLGLDALGLLKDRSFLVFFVASILICIPLAFYYNFTNPFLNEVGMERAAAKMTLGQASEVLFLLLMPYFFVRLGVKRMLLVGMLAWALRYVLFAYGDAGANTWMLLMGIILHGICYDFFFVTGQIYTDARAGERFKSSAQGLITLATYGAGMFIGSLLSGYIVDAYVVGEGHDWRGIWLIPAGMAFAILAVFAFTFREPKQKIEM